MAFCYRLKFRIPHPTRHGDSKVFTLSVPVPFKSRRMTGGRFGYANMDGADYGSRLLLAKALRVFKKKQQGSGGGDGYESF